MFIAALLGPTLDDLSALEASRSARPGTAQGWALVVGWWLLIIGRVTALTHGEI